MFVFTLAACADRVPAPVISSASEIGGSLVPVFVATNRERNEQGYFDRGRQETLELLSTKVSIPALHQPGDAPRYSKNPNPAKHFALVSQDQFTSDQAFVTAIRRALNKRSPEHREVTLYVHGFFNGYADSVFRMAQMHKDFDMKGVSVAFSWPSAGTPAGYAYDRDSTLYSRDALEKLIRLLNQAGARNLVVLGHSMGGMLVMETLRQIDRSQPGWVPGNINSVVLLSPDISVDVFKSQAEDIQRLPKHFIVVTSQKDKALQLSSKVSLGRDRLGLGNSVVELADLPITFVDITNFSEAGTNPHFVAAESPTLVALIASANNLPGHVKSGNGTVLGSLASTTKHIKNATTVSFPDDTVPTR